MPNKRSVKDLDLRGRRVLVRVDFNVPLAADGAVEDDARIAAAVPTIQYVLEQGGRPILASHLGRPKGKPAPEYSLRPVARCLEERLDHPVRFADDCIGPAAEAAVRDAAPGEIVLLENLRFHTGEEKGDEAFGRALAGLAEVYVNDAFGTAHRAHASMVWPPRVLPSGAGFLLQAEIRALSSLLSADVARPFHLLLGGAKVSDKIGVVRHLLDRVDSILVGGAMAYALMAARGEPIGKSLCEEGGVEQARELLDRAADVDVQVVLPEDHVTVTEFRADSPPAVEAVISPDRLGVDIGPATAERFQQVLAGARTVLWNGPLGVNEMEPFAAGTQAVGKALAENAAHVVVGGGDTASAVKHMGLLARFAHVSTGGGASLEFLEGRELPGIAALPDADE